MDLMAKAEQLTARRYVCCTFVLRKGCNSTFRSSCSLCMQQNSESEGGYLQSANCGRRGLFGGRGNAPFRFATNTVHFDNGAYTPIVDSQIKLLQQSIQQARSDAEQDQEDSSFILDELKTSQMILRGHGPGGDLRKLLKQKQPSLLAWLLGPRTNVISVRVSKICMPLLVHIASFPADLDVL